ncbi:outer membrane lipoprotein carrier protein LolA [Catenulispora sp. EB89]|uniref:LolA family protein n=1 Tax=Catenulispora sp. EB89 TaxID=3156257 RepID=UPI0035120EBD
MLVPLVAAAAVVAVAAVSHGLGASDSPRLPGISTLSLLKKMGKPQTPTVSGTVRLTVDVGLPKLPKLGGDGGADPMRLLSGVHFVRVATDDSGPEPRERIGVQDTLSEYDLYRDGSDLWAWDSSHQTARHSTVNALTAALLSFASPSELAKTFTGPTAVQTLLFDTAYSARQTTRVAGRDCYVLLVTPHSDGTTVGSVQVAVDAATGVPLSVAIYPTGSSSPAIRAEFETVSFAADPSELRFTPPPGAKVVEETTPALDTTANPVRGAGKGWTAAVAIGGFDLAKLISGLGGGGRTVQQPAPEGAAAVLAALAGTPGTPLQSYLRMMMAAGEKTPVGLVWSSRLVSLVFTPDQRLFIAFATPESLEATVAAEPLSLSPSPSPSPSSSSSNPEVGSHS